MKFYRYKIVEYASMDMDGEYSSSYPSLVCETYESIKETPCGHWIGFQQLKTPDNTELPLKDYKGWKRWVSNTTTKRFAYPTQEEALIGFIKRTEKRKKILKHQILNCNLTLGMAEGQLRRIMDKKIGEKIKFESSKTIKFDVKK